MTCRFQIINKNINHSKESDTPRFGKVTSKLKLKIIHQFQLQMIISVSVLNYCLSFIIQSDLKSLYKSLIHFTTSTTNSSPSTQLDRQSHQMFEQLINSLDVRPYYHYKYLYKPVFSFIYDCMIIQDSYQQFLLRIIEIMLEPSLQSTATESKINSRLGTANSQYFMQKLLRETASLSHFKTNNLKHYSTILTPLYKKNKSLPSIMTKMNRQKAQMQASLSKNHSKLNSSFSGYFRSEIGVRNEQLRKKKITKLKKIEQSGAKMAQMTPVQRDDGLFDMNFKLASLPNRCFDSLFPSIRYNATLFCNDKQVYLLGGFHQQGLQELSLFHRYDQEGRKWTQVKGQGECPKLSPCFHTVQIYKNSMVIVGGMSFDGQKGKRFNTELLIYNLQKNQWLRARGGVSLKHHATTLFGSTLMISGGINQKQKCSEDLYFITFTGGNLLNPLIFTVHNHADTNQKISHHKIVNTYEIDPNVRNHIRVDGVFSFGGQDQNGNLNNDLMIINVLGKVGQNLDIKFKKWQLVITNDDKPCPRKDHSLCMINKKGMAVLAGGLSQNGSQLTDVWLFDFVRLHWTRINTQPRIQQSIGTLTGHCACVMGTIVYLYNGNVEKKRQKAFWAMETDFSNYKAKKTIFSTKLPTFKSIHSEKQNISLLHI